MIKIDRSFVQRLGTARGGAALIEAVVRLARTLELPVVAEGIETPAELEALQRIGCDFGQGYLFTAPLPPSEFVEFLLAPAVATASLEESGGASATGARTRVSRP